MDWWTTLNINNRRGLGKTPKSSLRCVWPSCSAGLPIWHSRLMSRDPKLRGSLLLESPSPHWYECSEAKERLFSHGASGFLHWKNTSLSLVHSRDTPVAAWTALLYAGMSPGGGGGDFWWNKLFALLKNASCLSPGGGTTVRAWGRGMHVPWGPLGSLSSTALLVYTWLIFTWFWWQNAKQDWTFIISNSDKKEDLLIDNLTHFPLALKLTAITSSISWDFLIPHRVTGAQISCIWAVGTISTSEH